MSLDPERALQAAVLSALSADAPVAALLGSPPRLYDQPPERPDYPYLTIGPNQSRRLDALDSESVEHNFTLTIVSRFAGTEEAKAALDAVRTVLHGAILTLTDHRLINLTAGYGDVFRGADWRSTYAVLRLRAVTEPLS